MKMLCEIDFNALQKEIVSVEKSYKLLDTEHTCLKNKASALEKALSDIAVGKCGKYASLNEFALEKLKEIKKMYDA